MEEKREGRKILEILQEIYQIKSVQDLSIAIKLAYIVLEINECR